MSSEKYNLNFLIVGEQRLRTSYTVETINIKGIEGKEVECRLTNDNSGATQSYNWDKALRSIHGVLLTVDMTDRNTLEKAKDSINSVECHGKENMPIIIIGTKADDKSKQKITEQELKQFVGSYADAERSVFGPQIIGAETATGTESHSLLAFASGVVIENDPAIKSQRALTNKTIKSGILPELEAYTSGFNKFVAYLKAIFSLGRFTLGVAKQDEAEELKAKLKQPDANVSQLVKEYRQKNEKLVSDEIRSSSVFVKPYIKQQSLGVDVKLNKGDLGEILDKYSSPSKK